MRSKLHGINMGYAFVACAKAIVSAAAIFVATATYASADVKTLEPGKLTIGINGDMPMT